VIRFAFVTPADLLSSTNHPQEARPWSRSLGARRASPIGSRSWVPRS